MSVGYAVKRAVIVAISVVSASIRTLINLLFAVVAFVMGGYFGVAACFTHSRWAIIHLGLHSRPIYLSVPYHTSNAQLVVYLALVLGCLAMMVFLTSNIFKVWSRPAPQPQPLAERASQRLEQLRQPEN